jgi:predicted Zn finger-like uncharacterized protein
MNGGFATRCPACGTVFRVVPDQLRVSEGWVRCGRCAEVFNASANLIDLASPAAAPPAATRPERAAADSEFGPSPGAVGAADHPVDFELEFDLQKAASRAALEEQATQPGPDSVDTEGPAPPLNGRPDSVTADPPDPYEGKALPRWAESVLSPEPATEARPATQTPSFLHRAEQAQRWQRSRARGALAGASVLGLLLLGGQVLYAYRDVAAARFAPLRPPLEAACQALGCSVGAAHGIESLSVESSGLVRVEKSNVYRLSVAVRNRAGIDLAVPALDLTLTDAQGRLVARRVLNASELGSPGALIRAGSDQPFQATLQAATEPITGYTIDLFYP